MALPDVNGLAITYLATVLAVPVVSRVNDPRPDEFVQVRSAGGLTEQPVRTQTRLDIWAWAPDDPAAMALAVTVEGHLWALSGTSLLGPVVYDVQPFLTPRLDDDNELTGVSRAWMTYALTVRADDVIQPAPSIAP